MRTQNILYIIIGMIHNDKYRLTSTSVPLNACECMQNVVNAMLRVTTFDVNDLLTRHASCTLKHF